MTESPLIVQADGAVLLETQHPAYEDARARLATFAALEKSPAPRTPLDCIMLESGRVLESS